MGGNNRREELARSKRRKGAGGRGNAREKGYDRFSDLIQVKARLKGEVRRGDSRDHKLEMVKRERGAGQLSYAWAVRSIMGGRQDQEGEDQNGVSPKRIYWRRKKTDEGKKRKGTSTYGGRIPVAWYRERKKRKKVGGRKRSHDTQNCIPSEKKKSRKSREVGERVCPGSRKMGKDVQGRTKKSGTEARGGEGSYEPVQAPRRKLTLIDAEIEFGEKRRRRGGGKCKRRADQEKEVGPGGKIFRGSNKKVT